MKYLAHIMLAVLVTVVFIGCCEQPEEECCSSMWTGNERVIQSKDVLHKEIDQKIEMVKEFCKEQNLKGMLFTQVRNVYWITAGLANNQIVLNKDVGAASLLIMADGKKYFVANGAEADRMMDGVLKELGYELKFFDWYNANPKNDVRGALIDELADGGTIGSDAAFPNTKDVAGAFKPLRFQLLDSEIERYKWLGEQCTEATQEVCKIIKPGMNEYEIEAITAQEFWKRGILPTVILTAVDDRVIKYRHALPGGATLKKYAMINIVAEKWGMPIAVTRFVHFGEMPEDLKTKFEKTAIVNAHFQLHTKPGTDVAEMWEKIKTWYASVGYEGEWKLHHQGGAIGYDDREWVVYPNIDAQILPNQGFAWNPTITGAKVEDTFVSTDSGNIIVTRSGKWPMINVELDGYVFPQPGVLIRDAETLKPVIQEDITVKAE